ncbi:MAG: ABC transporter permease [Thaumarchaeota archaeon]|nr:ABC transporter permease [Nitrososphaerota archaeon]
MKKADIPLPEPRRKSELRYTLHLLRENPIVLFGSTIAIGSVVLALISGLIFNPNSWNSQKLVLRLCWNNPLTNWGIHNLYVCPGTNVYTLGTDAYGRDLLQMIVLSLPLDLEVALTIVGSAVAIGVSLGAVAAYAGGLLDELVLRVTDVFFSIPGLSLAIVLVTFFTHNLFWLTVAVLITWWPTYVRLIRSQVLSEKEKPYVEALRSTGAGRVRILFRHIVPNSIYPVLVQATLDIGGVILVFSTLMFIGFSPSPLLPELGNLANAGIENVFIAPWLVIFPGLTILLIALGFNLLGDGIRDALDPRLRR